MVESLEASASSRSLELELDNSPECGVWIPDSKKDGRLEDEYILGDIVGRTPDPDSNLDLSVISRLVYCESSVLDHSATEAGIRLTLVTFNQCLQYKPSANCQLSPLQPWTVPTTAQQLFSMGVRQCDAIHARYEIMSRDRIHHDTQVILSHFSLSNPCISLCLFLHLHVHLVALPRPSSRSFDPNVDCIVRRLPAGS
uniref:Uncharacterized protein n=1 Tax=Timema bartmani TaxID=61472 RepID=A0A7R9EZ07_9NEOP|nr:unnamed protein product [Timema bartmani]